MTFKTVYQFRISLKGIRPPIWRRIQVPENYTFFELHVAIQLAMGWQCAHLHEFQMVHPQSGKKARIVTDINEELISVESFKKGFMLFIDFLDIDNELTDEEKKELLDSYEKNIKEEQEMLFDEHKEKISDWFSLENNVALYIYDFGDWFEHRIKLEKILPRDSNIQYPICIAGKRACPPEDCGGPSAYMDFLRMLKDPSVEADDELLEWYGADFDPEYFDPKEVNFKKFKQYLKRCKQLF